MKLSHGLALVVALTLASLPALADEKTSGERLLEDAIKRLRAKWYDRKSGIDWEALASKYRERLRESESPRAARELVNEMLGTLHTSHLALIDGKVYERELGSEFEAKRTPRAGCELVLLDGKIFATTIYEDGPAAKAGIAAGDEIVSIESQEPLASARVLDSAHDPGLPGPKAFALLVQKDERIPVVIRHERGGATREVVLEPFETCLLDAARSSVKVIDVKGHKLSRIHLPHFQTPKIARLLEESLDGPLAKGEALVLDVRGRGGYANVVNEVLANFKGERPRWKKPVIVLIDGGTRSAKEVFAWSFRRQGLGRLVGERTAGAVIGCGFEKLFDGSVLMLPIMDVQKMTGGEKLEGVGVEPDVTVDPGPLPYREGRDRIAERGEEVATERLLERARHVYQ
jgi:carboxyl-terminal processing protease